MTTPITDADLANLDALSEQVEYNRAHDYVEPENLCWRQERTFAALLMNAYPSLRARITLAEAAVRSPS